MLKKMILMLIEINLNNFQELMSQNKFKDFGAQKGLEKFENAIAKSKLPCYNTLVSDHRAPHQHWDVAKR